MRVTFKDIYHDYKNFRKAYYFYQLDTPRQIMSKHEVPVDMEKFKLGHSIFEFFKNHHNH